MEKYLESHFAESAKMRKYKMGSGEIELDVSREACARFGVFPGDRIANPRGERATVIGVRGDQLYYEKGVGDITKWANVHDKESFEKIGFKVIERASADSPSKEEAGHRPKYRVGERVARTDSASGKKVWFGEVVKDEEDGYVEVRSKKDGTVQLVKAEGFVLADADSQPEKSAERHPKFKVGDMVIGNKKADDYVFTTKGWIGKVIEVLPNEKIHVENKSRKRYTVLSERFDLFEGKEPPSDLPVAEEENDNIPIVEKVAREKSEPAISPIETDHSEGKIFILETELPLFQGEKALIPPAENFRHFTLDKRTLETIEKIATAVELKEPCLLEGETSTSKTSSIEYLAMLVKSEVSRMNLNGQTDTSELIGKFVPNDGSLQIEFEQLLAKPELLNEQTRAILQRANSDGRGLSMLESQKIAQSEGINVPDWRWQDGLVPLAMKKGQWIILDEINLAEPQILERLNSVLEKNSSITLSENGGVKIGKGGEFDVHPNFRIFATMNPAEYAGRQPMSPAYKDRWTSFKFVESPSQEDYFAMLQLMVYGEQPEVDIRGQKYQGEKTSSMFQVLEDIPNFRGFLAKLSKFQVTIEDLARRRVIGKNKKEKYIFTRRGLIEFLDYLENKTLVDRRTKEKLSIRNAPQEVVQRAIQYYFLDKIADPDDLKKVEDQLDAIGISRENWTHEFFDKRAKEAEKAKQPVAEIPKAKTEAKTEAGLEGRDPQKFLDEVFDWIEKNRDWNSKSEWSWVISKDGHLINMCGRSSEIPDEFFNKEREEVGFVDGERIKGIGELIKKLRGKRVISLRVDEDEWYLQVVGKESGGDSKKEEPKTYRFLGGKEVELSKLEEFEGYKVGDRLKFRDEVDDIRSEISDAKEIRVVGFTEDGDVVKQYDGEYCTRDNPEQTSRLFERA